jgi:glycosyltransferase involved in cell wall biosynthesis
MKYSVIIPSYNHEKYIAEAIYSALNQSLPPHEVIVIDDGSNDRSVEICHEIATKHSNLIVVQQENAGAHNAINRGIRMATSDHVAILNSDDVYRPERFDTLSRYCSDKWDLIGSELQLIDANSKPIPKTRWLRNALICQMFLRNNIISLAYANYFMTTSNFLMKKSFFEKIGPFKSYRYCHDLDFLIRASKNGHILYLNSELLEYRFHNTNTVRESTNKVLLEAWVVILDNLQNYNAKSRGTLLCLLRIIALFNSQYSFFKEAYNKKKV